MRHAAKRLIVYLVAVSVSFLGILEPAQAAMIGTAQVSAADAADSRARISAQMERPAVQARLQELGIDPAEAKARVDALSDVEAAALGRDIDSLPAGGDGIVGALVFIFLVLLVTDLLGLTKVYPFTRPAKR